MRIFFSSLGSFGTSRARISSARRSFSEVSRSISSRTIAFIAGSVSPSWRARLSASSCSIFRYRAWAAATGRRSASSRPILCISRGFPVTDGSDSSRSSSGIRVVTDSSLSHKGDLRTRRPRHAPERRDRHLDLRQVRLPSGQPLQPQPRRDERAEPGGPGLFADSRSTS